ncbi:hypothetical protein DUNSADRAFT_5777, partial [Dunaliella salina]
GWALPRNFHICKGRTRAFAVLCGVPHLDHSALSQSCSTRCSIPPSCGRCKPCSHDGVPYVTRLLPGCLHGTHAVSYAVPHCR